MGSECLATVAVTLCFGRNRFCVVKIRLRGLAAHYPIMTFNFFNFQLNSKNNEVILVCVAWTGTSHTSVFIWYLLMWELWTVPSDSLWFFYHWSCSHHCDHQCHIPPLCGCWQCWAKPTFIANIAAKPRCRSPIKCIYGKMFHTKSFFCCHGLKSCQVVIMLPLP